MAETLSVVDLLPNKFEPKRVNRYILAAEGLDLFLIKTFDRPSFTIKEVKIPWINTQRYIAGKMEFGTINMVLHDPIAPSAAQQVMEWARTCTEMVSGRSGYADFYKRDLQIKGLDGLGTTVELTDVFGAFPTSVKFSSVDYNSDEIANISLTLRFDLSVLQF